MSLVNFIKSKVFLKQIVIAFLAFAVISFLMLRYLKSTTNHGNFEVVPNLKGKSIDVAKIELENNKLVMQIQDSANYNPNYPKFSVIEQEPIAGANVKENRKIYLTLNPSGYPKIKLPNIIDRTYRQAKPTLLQLGFKVGKIAYVKNIGKDEVLGMRYKGKSIKPGALIAKNETIDLVLGDGN